jgi:peptidoglycan/xylan/chitin deacetylase (PgdA/CDA1 family)
MACGLEWAGAALGRGDRPRQAVLCYHSIGDRDAPLATPASAFRSQIVLLKQLGYGFLTYTELVRAARNNPGDMGNAVALTFDDGLADNYCEAMPILLDAGVKATFFVPSGLVVGEGSAIERYRHCCRYAGKFMAPSQLREMQQMGMEIGAHTHTHCALATLSDAQALCELEHAKETLEQIVQKPVTSMAYPFGAKRFHFTENTCRLAQAAGYETAASLLPCTLSRWSVRSPFEVPRFCIGREDTLTSLKQRVRGQADWVGLYHLYRSAWLSDGRVRREQERLCQVADDYAQGGRSRTTGVGKGNL